MLLKNYLNFKKIDKLKKIWYIQIKIRENLIPKKKLGLYNFFYFNVRNMLTCNKILIVIIINTKIQFVEW